MHFETYHPKIFPHMLYYVCIHTSPNDILAIGCASSTIETLATIAARKHYPGKRVHTHVMSRPKKKSCVKFTYVDYADWKHKEMN